MATRKHHSDVSMAHDFFYLGVGERTSKSYASCNVSYDADGLRCFSYSTVIAKVIPRKGYKEADVDPHHIETGLTLTSSDYMTATTCKHISHVRGASPFDVIQVPMRMDGRDLSPNELASRILGNLEELKKHFNHADSRREFVRLLDVRKEIAAKACTAWAKPFVKKAFDQYEKLRPELDRIAKELQAKARVKAAAESKRRKLAAEHAEKIRAKWLIERTGSDYLNFLRGVFGDVADPKDPYAFNPVDRTVLREALVGDNYRTAFVWIEGENVCTSKGIHIPLKTVRVALKAWAAGKDMRTVMVDNYAVVSYEGDVIQIGCHHIPRPNLLALYTAVTGKRFPGIRKEAA